jgi:CHAD domain-containing protein
MDSEILNKILGPVGALVLAIVCLRWVVKQWREEVKLLRANLSAEHQARLKDAKAATETLLHLNDRLHHTIAQLSEIASSIRKSSRSTHPPPSAAPARASTAAPKRSEP